MTVAEMIKSHPDLALDPDEHPHCALSAQVCRRLEAAARSLLETLRDEGVPQPEER